MGCGFFKNRRNSLVIFLNAHSDNIIVDVASSFKAKIINHSGSLSYVRSLNAKTVIEPVYLLFGRCWRGRRYGVVKERSSDIPVRAKTLGQECPSYVYLITAAGIFLSKLPLMTGDCRLPV